MLIKISKLHVPLYNVIQLRQSSILNIIMFLMKMQLHVSLVLSNCLSFDIVLYDYYFFN